jgi:hypothetical protein
VRGRGARREYHWPNAQTDLAMGVHPEVVAARMGLHISTILDTADAQGWAVSFRPVPPDQIIDAVERMFK